MAAVTGSFNPVHTLGLSITIPPESAKIPADESAAFEAVTDALTALAQVYVDQYAQTDAQVSCVPSLTRTTVGPGDTLELVVTAGEVAE